MKYKLLSFMALLGLIINLSHCSKAENEVEPEEVVLEIETAPSAQSQDDLKSSGVYKGTFVGSSGSFKLIIQANQIVGYLVVYEEDGFNKSYLLTTEDITASNLSEAITNALFTDANGDVQLHFSVEADGQNPTVSLAIKGHENIEVVVLKETSTNLLKIYEGFKYTSYPNQGIQVKAHLNLMLGIDTVGRISYKTIDEFPLNNGLNGTHGDEQWARDVVYHVHQYTSEKFINVYRHYPNPDNPLGPGLIEYLFDGVAYTDSIIKDEWSWMDNAITYTDSIRLERKL